MACSTNYSGIQYTIYNIQYTIYNIQYTIQKTIYNIQYTIYTFAVCGIQNHLTSSVFIGYKYKLKMLNSRFRVYTQPT